MYYLFLNIFFVFYIKRLGQRQVARGGVFDLESVRVSRTISVLKFKHIK